MTQVQTALLLPTKFSPDFVVSTIPRHSPGPGELLIKVHAVALNPLDWKVQAYGIFYEDYPLVLGNDVAGEVVGLGEGVDANKWRVGERVICPSEGKPQRYGGFQEYMCYPEDIVARIPSTLSYLSACTIPLGFSTAAVGLLAPSPIGAGLSPDLDMTSVKGTRNAALVIGGSTSVGQFAIQLLSRLAFPIIITYASSKHFSFLASLGATHFIDRAKADLNGIEEECRKVLESTAAHYEMNIVYDAVSSDASQQVGYACLGLNTDVNTSASDAMSGSDERISTMITVLPVSSALEASSSSSSNKNGGTRKRVFLVFGGVLSPSHREFGRKMFRKLEEWLHEDGPGRIQPNRYTELVSTYDTKADGSSPVELGLARIPEGLERLKKGEVSGEKLVVRLV